MKIGPLDIGIKTLALSAAIVVVAMLDLKLALSNNTRIEGFYRVRIPEYLMTGINREYEDGIKQCDNLLTVLRGNVPARLYRATFLYRLKNYDKAKEAFLAIANESAATAPQRAMASFGVGTVVFQVRPEGEKAAAAVEACEWYLKAVKLDPELTDAKVGILAAAIWRLSTVEEGADTPEAKAVYKQVGEWLSHVLKEAGPESKTAAAVNSLLVKALDVLEKERRPANFEGMALFYQLKGMVLGRVEQVVESEAAFDAAQAIQIRWPSAVNNQWRMMLKLLPGAKMKLADREALLQKYQARTQNFPKDAPVAFNAFGVGWYRTKESTSDVNFVNRGFPQAIEALRPGFDNGEPVAMMNAIALLDERLYERLLLPISPDFFLPFPPQTSGNLWIGEEAAKKKPLSIEAQQYLGPVRQAADGMQKLLTTFVKRGRLDAKREVDLKLRILACETIMAHVEASERPRWVELATRATELKAQAADVPEVLRAFAYLMFMAGNYGEAGKALRRAAELDPNNQKISGLVAAVSATPKLVHPRPSKNGWFGERALVRVTMFSPQAPGGISGGEMLYDGQKVEALTVGSQLVYLVPEGRLSDGKHVIKASALDGYGNKAEIEFEFGVDKVPPNAGAEPAPGGDVAGPLPVWTIKLSDEGVGVDLMSVQVRLKNIGGGATPCRSVLVENGTYQVDMAGTPAKRGERVPGETFKVASVINLTPGQYELTVSLSDQAGNKRTQSWVYQVK